MDKIGRKISAVFCCRSTSNENDPVSEKRECSNASNQQQCFHTSNEIVTGSETNHVVAECDRYQLEDSAVRKSFTDLGDTSSLPAQRSFVKCVEPHRGALVPSTDLIEPAHIVNVSAVKRYNNFDDSFSRFPPKDVVNADRPAQVNWVEILNLQDDKLAQPLKKVFALNCFCLFRNFCVNSNFCSERRISKIVQFSNLKFRPRNCADTGSFASVVSSFTAKLKGLVVPLAFFSVCSVETRMGGGVSSVSKRESLVDVLCHVANDEACRLRTLSFLRTEQSTGSSIRMTFLPAKMTASVRSSVDDYLDECERKKSSSSQDWGTSLSSKYSYRSSNSTYTN